jgi:hypothetical protein
VGEIGWEAESNVTLHGAGPWRYAPNATNIQQLMYSPHLMMRLIDGKATSGRPSCDVCTALPLVSMWPWGSEVIIQLSPIRVRWPQLAERHQQWWLHSASPPCCSAWELLSPQTVCTVCGNGGECNRNMRETVSVVMTVSLKHLWGHITPYGMKVLCVEWDCWFLLYVENTI